LQFPLLFYGVDGTCDKLEDSASFYNNDEGEAVYGVIKRLLEDPELDVKIDDFGVMAPFKAQASGMLLGCTASPSSLHVSAWLVNVSLFRSSCYAASFEPKT
jgi:hypothetical protein